MGLMRAVRCFVIRIRAPTSRSWTTTRESEIMATLTPVTPGELLLGNSSFRCSSRSIVWPKR